MTELQQRIEAAFEDRANITPANADASLVADVKSVLAMLDSGAARVAEKQDGKWVVNEWLKKAVLLSFRLFDNQVMEGAETRFYDKVPMKFADYDEARFRAEGMRVVPGSGSPGRLYRQEHRVDALLRQHRCLRRRRHHGRHLGHCGLLCPNW